MITLNNKYDVDMKLSKIRRFRDHAVIISAGLTSVTDEAFRLLSGKDQAHVYTVLDIAKAYHEHLSAVAKRHAEHDVLSKYNLTYATLNAQQGQLHAATIGRIMQELADFWRGMEVAALVAGVDDTGPHIVTLRLDGIVCADRPGFDVIGAGNHECRGYLVHAGHTPDASMGNTLFHLYGAKRYAEIVRGIGPTTDMVVIGRSGHLVEDVPPDVMNQLEAARKDGLGAIAKIQDEKQLAFRVAAKGWLGD